MLHVAAPLVFFFFVHRSVLKQDNKRNKNKTDLIVVSYLLSFCVCVLLEMSQDPRFFDEMRTGGRIKGNIYI